jgi:hypothetical protein
MKEFLALALDRKVVVESQVDLLYVKLQKVKVETFCLLKRVLV